ncbi:MAG TPA: hypothetical protein VFM03_01545, partial [Candidatus Limnocylindria bacterium]|nr:hypothetical protein [Candidatus Limnocylindria bacterium]
MWRDDARLTADLASQLSALGASARAADEMPDAGFAADLRQRLLADYPAPAPVAPVRRWTLGDLLGRRRLAPILAMATLALAVGAVAGAILRPAEAPRSTPPP